MKARLCYAISFLLIISVFLSACGVENEEFIGVYSCVELSLDGESFDVAEIYPEGLELELMNYGQAWLNINGDRVYGRWTLEGERFSLDIRGEISEGRLSDGVCHLGLTGSEIEHVLVRDGEKIPLPQTGENRDDAELSERQLFWNGDWYGYWTLENASGFWLDQSGQSFDCFARFDIADDNTGTMVFWDELQSFDEPVAKLELLISDSADETMAGVAVSTGGFFYDTVIEETQWSVDPAYGSFDSAFVVENGHYDSESGSFDYSIVLRPWGRTWEDVEAVNADMLPYFYYDWYLPQLASGKPMPDSFEPPEKSVVRNTWTQPEDTEVT